MNELEKIHIDQMILMHENHIKQMKKKISDMEMQIISTTRIIDKYKHKLKSNEDVHRG
jgi:hypothetical protein